MSHRAPPWGRFWGGARTRERRLSADFPSCRPGARGPATLRSGLVEHRSYVRSFSAKTHSSHEPPRATTRREWAVHGGVVFYSTNKQAERERATEATRTRCCCCCYAVSTKVARLHPRGNLAHRPRPELTWPSRLGGSRRCPRRRHRGWSAGLCGHLQLSSKRAESCRPHAPG